MASVSKRIRRNVIARKMAIQAGLLTREHHPPLPFYRTIMLQTLRILRERWKKAHHEEQTKTGRLSRLARFYGGWKKSWLRRFLEKLFPSLREDVRQARKAERARKEKQRDMEQTLRHTTTTNKGRGA